MAEPCCKRQGKMQSELPNTSLSRTDYDRLQNLHPDAQKWAGQLTRLKQLRPMLNLANDPEDGTEITLPDLGREAMDEYLDRQTQPAKPNGQPSRVTRG